MKKPNNIVKKFQIYSLLVLFLGLTTTLQAQSYVETRNYLGLNVEAGAWGLLPSGDTRLKAGVGPGAELGFVYELQHKHFLFQTGVGAEFGYAIFNSDSASAVGLPAIDMNDDYFLYTYEFGKRRDNYMDLSVELPVLFGGQWNRFYFLAGAKVKFHAMTRAHVKGNLTTFGDYSPVFGDFRDMPEYEFVTDNELTRDVNSSLNLDVAASAEIGMRLGEIYHGTGFDVPKQRTIYRLALFADYGLLNLRKDKGLAPIVTPPMYIDGHMLEGLTYNDILSTANVAKKVNSLFVGLKFTILFQVGGGDHRCLICDDDHGRRRGRSGGGKVATDF